MPSMAVLFSSHLFSVYFFLPSSNSSLTYLRMPSHPAATNPSPKLPLTQVPSHHPHYSHHTLPTHHTFHSLLPPLSPSIFSLCYDDRDWDRNLGMLVMTGFFFFFFCIHMGLVATMEVVVDFGSELLRFWLWWWWMILALVLGFMDFGYGIRGLWLWLWLWWWVVVSGSDSGFCGFWLWQW